MRDIPLPFWQWWWAAHLLGTLVWFQGSDGQSIQKAQLMGRHLRQ